MESIRRSLPFETSPQPELQRNHESTQTTVHILQRIVFVSTRISGTDGVSLEVAKWAEVLERMGHQCFYIAGQCDDRPAEK